MIARFRVGIPVCFDEVADGLGQGQRLGHADLPFARTIEPVAGVGNHGEIAGGVRRRRKDRRDDRLRCDAAQGVQPGPAPGGRGSRARGRGAARRGCGNRLVRAAPQRTQVSRVEGSGGIQCRQAGGKDVEALAAVPSRLEDAGLERIDKARAQEICVVSDEIIGQPDRVTLLASVDRPDQRDGRWSRIRRCRLPAR